ncbi:hypothetical protein [Tahibacter amnicola]|uniref:Uncharacterized protein n=1 Tax=Tahibacter amnicola TaxID=2976241 RepID=A0ABY6BM36_9GAMM|nr:hypothetical protein [Tahibacter amnicola]UXI70513.1 hypothetical protein N4264_13005 [Tahibacter amnicola]
MSFDLFVLGDALWNVPELPSRLRKTLHDGGLDCEWHPDFVLTRTFRSAVVPFKIRINPEAVPEHDCYGDQPLLSFLHLARSSNDRLGHIRRAPWPLKLRAFSAATEYMLTTSAGRTPLDFRLQLTFAAALCLYANGTLVDPQDDQTYFERRKAYPHLFLLARHNDIASAREEPEWDLPRFDSWPALQIS